MYVNFFINQYQFFLSHLALAYIKILTKLFDFYLGPILKNKKINCNTERQWYLSYTHVQYVHSLSIFDSSLIFEPVICRSDYLI